MHRLPHHLARLITAASVCASALNLPAEPKFNKIETVNVPGWTQEIVQYCPSERLLLATNGPWKSVDLYVVESFDPPVLHVVDLDDVEPGPQGFLVPYEPTSVAVHPTLPIALTAVLGRGPTHEGSIVAHDLRRGVGDAVKLDIPQDAATPAAVEGLIANHDFGSTMLRQKVGFHPDSLAVSPDGRWLVVACEGEGDPDSPGSVWCVDLTGLTPDRRAKQGDLPAYELPGLAKLVGEPLGVIEPEFVAFDPQSRFAVVSLQENNAFVAVDLSTHAAPRLASIARVTYEGEPDGLDVLANVPGPDGRVGCLVGITEEGKFNRYGQTTGNRASFYWLDPDQLDAPATMLSSVDVRPLLDPEAPEKRRDPEALKFVRLDGKLYAVVGVERGDQLMLFDVSDPTSPQLVAKPKAGDRPEGLTLVKDGEGFIVITGDEGDWGPGTLTFLRLQPE